MSCRRSSRSWALFLACVVVLVSCGADDAADASSGSDTATGLTTSTAVAPVSRPGRTVFVEPSLWPETVRIQMIGDSITAGPHTRGSLWDELIERNCDADLVGTQNDFADLVGDADHDGYEGFAIAEIAALVPDVIERERPDVVLVHAGTNDLAPGVDVAAAVGRLEALVRSVLSTAPSVRVIVAEIVPLDGAITEVEAFNDGVAAMVTRLAEVEDRAVTVVDQFTGFDLARDSDDGVHPNESGGRKAGVRWADALESVEGPCSTP